MVEEFHKYILQLITLKPCKLMIILFLYFLHYYSYPIIVLQKFRQIHFILIPAYTISVINIILILLMDRLFNG
jgi:hypothetical protein